MSTAIDYQSPKSDIVFNILGRRFRMLGLSRWFHFVDYVEDPAKVEEQAHKLGVTIQNSKPLYGRHK